MFCEAQNILVDTRCAVIGASGTLPYAAIKQN
jgi:hypothetical protein